MKPFIPEEYFLKMIEVLRQEEAVVLYGEVLQTGQAEDKAVATFLEAAYRAEALSHPSNIPAFDAAAAVWAAKTVYTTAQLILYRKHEPAELPALLPHYEGAINTAALLSADLCLRFLPDMLRKLEAIDSDDAMIPVLKDILARWSYSAIRYKGDTGAPDLAPVLADETMKHIYANRIIEYKKLALAVLPPFKPVIAGYLGGYAATCWDEFKQATIIDE